MAEFTTDDGVRLHYTDQGEGPPVVLIAGFRAAATSWLFQTGYLLERGFRVIAFDRRGHGLSESADHGARMARHGKDLAELLAVTGLHRDPGSERGLPSEPGARHCAETRKGEGVVLIGGSMGGSTIWSYLDLFGADRLRAVITVDQTPKMSNEDGWEHGYYGYDAANLGTFFAAGPPATGRGTPLEQRGARWDRMLEAMRLQPEPRPMSAAELALLRDHAVQDWRDVIARIKIPMLLVAGRDSELWPAEHAPAAAALNPLAGHVILDDCGHAANIEQPEAFNAAVVNFLRR